MIHEYPITLFPKVIKNLSQRIFSKVRNISIAKHIKGARFTFFLRKINGNGPLWNIRIAYQKIILSCFSFMNLSEDLLVRWQEGYFRIPDLGQWWGKTCSIKYFEMKHWVSMGNLQLCGKTGKTVISPWSISLPLVFWFNIIEYISLHSIFHTNHQSFDNM